MKEKPFFERCKVYWWGGYYIPVRNKFTYNICKRHISEKQKDQYEKQFGEKILMDSQFEEWYLNQYK